MKAVFCGFYGKHNLGDEQYRISFPILFPAWDCVFADQGLTEQVIAHADLVVLGGGNVLEPKFLERIRPLAHRKALMALSVGCTSQEITHEQLSVFERIWVRDRESQKILESKEIESDLVPDAAWVLTPDPANGDRIWREVFSTEHADLYAKKVAVVLNGHLTTRQPDQLARDANRFQMVASDLAQIIDHTSASFAFLPFGTAMPWDDRIPNAWTAQKCKWFAKNVVVHDRWTVQVALDFIAAADAVISTRYHSSVFAAIAGTPFLDIHHHDKNKNFLQMTGLQAWGVPYYDFSRERSQKILDQHLAGTKNDDLAAVNRRAVLAYSSILANYF